MNGADVGNHYVKHCWNEKSMLSRTKFYIKKSSCLVHGRILGMSRAIGMYEHRKVRTFPYHHYIIGGYPGGRKICNTGGQLVEDCW